MRGGFGPARPFISDAKARTGWLTANDIAFEAVGALAKTGPAAAIKAKALVANVSPKRFGMSFPCASS